MMIWIMYLFLPEVQTIVGNCESSSDGAGTGEWTQVSNVGIVGLDVLSVQQRQFSNSSLSMRLVDRDSRHCALIGRDSLRTVQ